MATIRARRNADGTVMYTAQIRIKRGGAQVYQESASFSRKKAAEAWALRREAELAEPGGLERATKKGVLLRNIIAQYLADRDKTRPLGKTKIATLTAIAASHLGDTIDRDITSQVLVDYALWRMGPDGGGVKAQTVANDLAHLGSVLGVAEAAWGYQVDPDVMAKARRVLKNLGYKLRSRERDRRPTLEELDRLFQAFERSWRSRPTSMCMAKVAAFALFSSRRQEEIIRIRWADLDEARGAVLVRDMKNPGDKRGNDVWCQLPEEAMAVIKSMPRAFDEIFPYTTDAIQGAWSRAITAAGIEDLTFHDLRHEAISRLFELEWDIPKVASVSGHRDWNSLRRYTHLRGSGDKYAGWEWLPKVLAMPVSFGEWVSKKKSGRRSGSV
ncbi:TPA: site-specific integrase [Pseudomonas aeruginosa]|uniref:site-specific integrase n=1 Tax=Pseudomonas aeruginosa TaxID=287 RepID=UPI0003D3C00B|nr:site-specific integrase [Pseudomonas aeruginosa]ELK2663459.1 site-specific integrase [Pseudomonas aeruginosa]ELN5415856.1 site-specific integrase [Pseudomonas aeruginosa]EME0450676.1 site-specific integrase [Pseudomonas aeruginosa]EME7060132.1 site-specific integrase [Pseudomonas aeruginosa]ETD42441.1 integrase [Pseudomonas aeruginosa VRFPA08]